MLAGLLAWAVVASAEPLPEMELASCVSGTPPLRLAPSAPRAVLDAADGRRFHDAAQARYPMYQRVGLAPARVLMIRHGSQWRYVTLWQRGTSDLCFSAVFAAERFDFTNGWLAKYQPRSAGPDD